MAFDCTGLREDQNYPHPTDPHKYVQCRGGTAFEVQCPKCNFDAVSCPDGFLSFDQITNKCLFDNEVE
ncbi:carbohydrate-binding module family 14 protein [Nocardia sp. NPDC051321]|uniref:carbohydrate-binding module family 14 protein n=1 Tax=Nocardia sp. NPDC051321 TaxID=3364323 RepID=UPI00379FF0B2